MDIGSEAPLWLRASAWASRAAQGLANAGVWAAPFLRKRRTTPRRLGGAAAAAAAAAANEARLLGAEEGEGASVVNVISGAAPRGRAGALENALGLVWLRFLVVPQRFCLQALRKQLEAGLTCVTSPQYVLYCIHVVCIGAAAGAMTVISAAPVVWYHITKTTSFHLIQRREPMSRGDCAHAPMNAPQSKGSSTRCKRRS